eukprot:6049287-Amphidinium_carterae.1
MIVRCPCGEGLEFWFMPKLATFVFQSHSRDCRSEQTLSACNRVIAPTSELPRIRKGTCA